jgi:hypothetical protein
MTDTKYRTVGPWTIADGPAGRELIRTVTDPHIRRLWADVDRVPGKGPARRVIVLGESMARGYLLDPVVTLASSLQHALDRAAGPGRYQCVDLARTGAGMADLARILVTLPQLEADIVVFAAGNNWYLQQLTRSDGELLADAMAESGVPGLRRAFRNRIVEPRMQRLFSILARSSPRTVIVLPEFNLVEWEPDGTWSTGILPRGQDAEWHRHLGQARSATERQAWELALTECDRMTRIDGGTSQLPDRIRGTTMLALGDYDGARRSWEASRDAITGQLLVHTPRITAHGQSALAAFAAAHDHPVVDLRHELAMTPSGLPDPRFFLDYCHLSAEGLAVTARATAERITGLSEPAAASAGELVPARLDALSHLLAACHNAWHGQPATTLSRHISTAIRLGGRTEAVALSKLLASPAPSWMLPEFAQLCGFPQAERYLSPNTSRSWESLARGPLPSVLAGQLNISPAVAVDGPPLDLLNARHDDAGDLTLAPRHAFHRSSSPVFESTFTGGAAGGIRLVVQYRTPQASAAGQPGSLTVNGTAVAPVPPCPAGWRTIEVTVPAEPVMTARIHWPAAEQDHLRSRAAVAEALRTGRPRELLPIRGEIFSASARRT